ncbi:MAG: hypothetical protein CL840_01250 [Crocinitomicaceae bacterium]|jgi:hypothetical protein|nr:hypothetical protein [Crocinitomicaceae bacterium]|tara:strand:+ start:36973 stop:37911 length:939 start_codon:yes stop_codon:yes gene_type:complete
MHKFQSQLRKLISQQPDGANAFANLMGKSHTNFFGTGLGESKLNAYCATITGVKNANVFKALSDENNEAAVDAAYKALEALCNRAEDHIYDNTYLDFFYPIFTRPERKASEPTANVEEQSDAWRCTDCGATWSLGAADSDVPEVCPHCLDESAEDAPLMHVGIWTTVEFDHDEEQIRITQTIKSFNDDVGEYSECALAPSMNYGWGSQVRLQGMEADSTIPYKAEYLREDALAQLQSSEDKRFTTVAADWARVTENPSMYNIENGMVNILRAIQTMEIDRIINAIGVKPTPEFTRHQSQVCLFDGYVPFIEL